MPLKKMPGKNIAREIKFPGKKSFWGKKCRVKNVLGEQVCGEKVPMGKCPGKKMPGKNIAREIKFPGKKILGKKWPGKKRAWEKNCIEKKKSGEKSEWEKRSWEKCARGIKCLGKIVQGKV